MRLRYATLALLLIAPAFATAGPPCVCGDSCRCAAGECPSKCPVRAANPPGYGDPPAGYTWVRDARGPSGWGLLRAGAAPAGAVREQGPFEPCLPGHPITPSLVVPRAMPAAVPAASQPLAAPFRPGGASLFGNPSCPNGKCPNQR